MDQTTKYNAKFSEGKVQGAMKAYDRVGYLARGICDVQESFIDFI